MSENSGQQQLLVKARFNFQQTNEDELTFSKGDIIGVTRQEDGGWWEGMLNGKTGWFPSNYVRELKGSGRWTSTTAPVVGEQDNGFKSYCLILNADAFLSWITDKQVSPKSGTLKSPPKGFDTSAISKTYYNLVRTQNPLLTCITEQLLSLSVALSLCVPFLNICFSFF